MQTVHHTPANVKALPAEYITIDQRQSRWHWIHVKPAGALDTTSRTSYDSATAAALAAVNIARWGSVQPLPLYLPAPAPVAVEMFQEIYS